MPRPASRARRPSRFDQLTPEQEKTFCGDLAELFLTGRFRSFKGGEGLRKFFDIALRGFQTDVHDFVDAVALTDAFVLMCNSNQLKSKRAFEQNRSMLRGGVLAYARSRGLHRLPLRAWPEDLGEQVVKFLRQESLTRAGKPIASNTARKKYGAFCMLFAELGEHEKLAGLLPQLEPFPNSPFAGAHDETARTKSLGQPTLIAILRAARSELLQAVEKMRYAHALFQGAIVLPDSSARGRGQFRSLDAVLWYLHVHHPVKLPAFVALKAMEPSVFDAINTYHGGWRCVVEHFYPRPDSLVAPIILMTVYGHFNVEPLRALRIEDVRLISVMLNGHVEVRTSVKPGKERGAQPYRRSFPIDDADPGSPSSILQFLLEWTQTIRADAGTEADCVFIFKTKEGDVKTFDTAKRHGSSSDSKWKHHLAAFCSRHGLPKFNLMTLRQTSLDFAREISDNDIRELAALKGGSSESVLDFHYKSDAFESRAQAAIAGLQANKERYVRTRGKSHHLGAPKSQDLTAATPGCVCADPYDSPIPGELKDVQCGAFGCCPGCPHGSPELGSAYSLGRLLQLRDALQEARSNLPLELWVERYKRPLTVLEETWLPLFDDPQLWESVKRMSLQPIGVIE